jgi:hypothetical protein
MESEIPLTAIVRHHVNKKSLAAIPRLRAGGCDKTVYSALARSSHFLEIRQKLQSKTPNSRRNPPLRGAKARHHRTKVKHRRGDFPEKVAVLGRLDKIRIRKEHNDEL